MAIEFEVPDLGEGAESGQVSRIYVSEGDTIEADENVMELESEKAVMDLPCPHAGRITEIHVAEGDTIEVGQLLLTIEEEEGAADTEDEEAEEDATEAKEADQGDSEGEDDVPRREGGDEDDEDTDEAGDLDEDDEDEAAGEDGDREEADEDEAAGEEGDREEADEDAPAPAGPATRRLARELGVDLAELTPPEEGGVILQEEVVRAYVERRKVEGLADPGELPDFSELGEVERAPLGEVSRTAAERLGTSWRTIPHVTQHGEADITDLEQKRQRYVAAGGDEVAGVTLTAITISAVCGVLRELPEFNASLDLEAGERILKRYCHIGVAVDTERGLIVPVVRDADRKSIRAIAEEIADLAERARNRDLSREQLEGASFTLSNQGGIGGGHFTPIVAWPQVAILGLGRAREMPRIVDGEVRARLVLPLSLSYDHRAANGADAARFIERLAAVLSGPDKLLMEA